MFFDGNLEIPVFLMEILGGISPLEESPEPKKTGEGSTRIAEVLHQHLCSSGMPNTFQWHGPPRGLNRS